MTSPKAILRAWGLHPKRRLGQSFLSDPAIAKRIVNLSGLRADDIVLEIGAGLGSLTIPAANQSEHVYAVEKDQRIVRLLKTELLAYNLTNVTILEEDILKIDIEELAADRKLVVLGNLPYYISSQILVQLIGARHKIGKAILMFQKELAQRLIAQPGIKDYGRLSVMLQYCSELKTMIDVDASAFTPKPNVDSRVLEIQFKDQPPFPATDESFLFKVIKAAFGKRRKILKNALTKSELKFELEPVLKALKQACIVSNRRAETLSVEEFVRLSNVLLSIIGEN